MHGYFLRQTFQQKQYTNIVQNDHSFGNNTMQNHAGTIMLMSKKERNVRYKEYIYNIFYEVI